MSASAKDRRIVTTAGPAVGKITGINHIVMYVRDMNEGVKFYRDILGLKIVRTQPRFSTNPRSLQANAGHSSGPSVNAQSTPDDRSVDYSVRQIFFELGNGELFSLYETAAVTDRPDASLVSFLWPPVATRPPTHPQKLDHLAFNVETRADIEWFRNHLVAHGVAVSELVERRGEDNRHRFLLSLFFSDPSNNPIEIATFDRGDPGWIGYDYNEWFMDQDPVPALISSDPEP